jgi:hypothetical protein
MTAEEKLDLRVRRYVYDTALTTGRLPSSETTGKNLGLGLDEVRDSFERLAAGRVLVLQPDGTEILMAHPFSAVPTPFLVTAGSERFFANCIWDGLGILAMLGADGRVATACGCCGSAMELRVTDGSLEPADGVIHFAIAARHWWDDIVFT